MDNANPDTAGEENRPKDTRQRRLERALEQGLEETRFPVPIRST